MGKEENNILRSPYKPLVDYKGCSNLPELLLKVAKEHAENGKTEWMVDTLSGESYDFASFEDLSRRIASAFYKRGLRKGDVVVFMEIDIVKQPAFITGVWRANGICRATYPEEDEETLFDRVNESRTGWIYCEPFQAEMCLRVAEKIYWDVEVIVTGPPGENLPPGCTSVYELMEDDGSEFPEPDTTFKDTALIMCTSGTTGNSKGAVITQSALLWQFSACAYGMPPPENDTQVHMVFTKSTHISGLVIPFATLLSGQRVHLLTFISKERILQVVGKYKPRLIFGFPTFLLLIASEAESLDLTNLEYIMGSGAPVTPAVVQALMTSIPGLKSVVNVYGLTECAPLVTTLDSDHGRPLTIVPDGTIGKLCAGASAKFLDAETGKVVGPGEIGEFCVKCSGLFKCYYLNPKASKAAFTEPPCYFKTGDVGYYDENGFIFLVDRAKDIFKYLGNHVSPTEIENVLLAHPAISEVCVIAIPDPEGSGYIPRAFCVKNSHYPGVEEVTADDILEYANSKLASYKHVRGGVYFVPELPKGKTGKVTRHLVEQIDVNALEE